LCDINYGIYPEIIISGETDAYFPYISVHLEYIVFELLKNSMRATVEWAEHGKKRKKEKIFFPKKLNQE